MDNGLEKIHESINSIAIALDCLQHLHINKEQKNTFIKSMNIVKELQSNLYIRILKEIKDK